MTIDEHVNAIYLAIPDMSKEELANLGKNLSLISAEIQWKLNTNMYSQTHRRPENNRTD